MENTTVKTILLLLGWACIIAGVIIGILLLDTLPSRATGGEQFVAFIVPTIIGIFLSVGFFWMHVIVRELEGINTNLLKMKSSSTGVRNVKKGETLAPIEKAKDEKCISCGEKLIEGAAFCTECGQPN